MSSEQITQETVPVEKTETTEPQATIASVAKTDTPVSPTTEQQPRNLLETPRRALGS